MTAKSRYWHHEHCDWVAYQPMTIASPDALDEALPEQRADEESTPATAPVATA
jgi:hypothetical protein